MFVADFYNNRIQKFSPDGEFLTAFGTVGQGPGEFDKAIAVAPGAGNTVFAVDYGNQRVQRWKRR